MGSSLPPDMGSSLPPEPPMGRPKVPTYSQHPHSQRLRPSRVLQVCCGFRRLLLSPLNLSQGEPLFVALGPPLRNSPVLSPGWLGCLACLLVAREGWESPTHLLFHRWVLMAPQLHQGPLRGSGLISGPMSAGVPGLSPHMTSVCPHYVFPRIF